MSNLEDLIDELKSAVERAYNEGVTIPEAEKLAARTLSIRMAIADEIKTKDLDARMKKHGVKAVRGAAYSLEIGKFEKKPTESALEAAVNMSKTVHAAEEEYAEADTEKDRLQAYSDVFKDSHIFFRQLCKGTYE